jgi:hypothetical protein
VRALAFVVVAILAAAGPAWGDLEPQVLALCRSPDVAARRFCLESLAKSGDPDGAARAQVADLRDHDVELRDLAAATYARLYETAPARPPQTVRTAGDPSRVIYAPTAFTRAAGSYAFNAYEIGFLTIDYGLSDEVAIGAQTSLPVGFILGGVTLRGGVPFDGGAVGFYADALIAAPFSGGKGVAGIVGGPMVTLGSPDSYVNFGLLAAWGKSSDTAGAFAAHAGGSVRVGRRIRLGAEVYVPGIYGNDVSDSGFGKVAALLWGVRIFSDSLWGDIAMFDPICSGCGDIYKTIPLGIPFLNFGAGW